MPLKAVTVLITTRSRSNSKVQNVTRRWGMIGKAYCLMLVASFSLLSQAYAQGANSTAPSASGVNRDAVSGSELESMKSTSAGLDSAQRERVQGMFRQAFEFFRSGEFGAAERQFLRGLEIDPANAPANFYFAEVLSRLKKPELAKKHYQFVRQLAPESKEGLLAEDRLANLVAAEPPTTPVKPPVNLLTVPTTLEGRWCFSGVSGAGVVVFEGGSMNMRDGGTPNSGPVKVMSEKRFSVTMRSLFSSNESIYEMIDSTSFRLTTVADWNVPGRYTMRRC